MRRLKAWAALVLCLGVFAAAGCGERDFSKPPRILYGRDVCAQCRMTIEDERFACAAVSADKHFLKFDDIGCLASYERQRGGGHELRSWVRDAGSGEWVGRERAHFVHSRALVTPMGYGFAAFAGEQGAAQFAREKAGRLITWMELSSLTEERANTKMEEIK